jgi:hypothetical protein
MLSQCGNSQKRTKLRINSFSNRVDTLVTGKDTIITKQESFLVENFIDNSESEYFIDSFVQTHLKSIDKVTSDYLITFYKQTSKTNLENLRNNPRDLDRYSQQHDLIYQYSWSKGKFLSRFKFKDGNIISPEGDIKVEDVKIE